MEWFKYAPRAPRRGACAAVWGWRDGLAAVAVVRRVLAEPGAGRPRRPVPEPPRCAGMPGVGAGKRRREGRHARRRAGVRACARRAGLWQPAAPAAGAAACLPRAAREACAGSGVLTAPGTARVRAGFGGRRWHTDAGRACFALWWEQSVYGCLARQEAPEKGGG